MLFTVLFSVHSVAQTTEFTEQEISFRNGDVVLQGTLLLPDAQCSVPAMVFLHGSGTHARAGFRPYAEEFARLGIASLFFDKRGSGTSGGSWTTSSLEDLAGDALSAIEFLKNTEGIDPVRIGFWGISQARWVATRAAAKSDDIAFMIMISGGGASPRDSELFSWRKEFEKAGLSETQIAAATTLLNTVYNYLKTGEGRTELIAQIENLGSGTYDGLSDVPGEQREEFAGILERLAQIESEKNRTNWSWVGAYKPLQDITEVTFPVLLMFGELDTDHPTELAVKKWKEGLGVAGNHKATIMVFPKAGHGIRVGSEHSHTATFADGYEEVQLGWLWKYVVNNKN